tara:strand:+ start:805 stop:1686 length:882 start_codon:yes stop_codon:yes gene_type:complete
MISFKILLSTLRGKQWIKNLFVLSPFLISIDLYRFENIYIALMGFFSFSFISSVVYILNDISDKELDILHPKKKKRPIAAGKVSIKLANFICVLLLILTLLLVFNLESTFFLITILGFYLIINFFYSRIRFKEIPVLEFFIPAFGYPLRFLYGIILLGQPISPWLYLVTFSFSLFLILGKRYIEFEHFKNLDTRKVLKSYSSNFLLLSLVITSNLAIFSWIAFTFSEYALTRYSEHIWITSLLVTMGFLDYLRILLDKENSSFEDPLDLVIENPSLLIISMVFLFIFGFLTLL